MIGATLVVVGALSSAAADLPLLPEAENYSEQASAWLLDGQALPPDYRVALMRMSPDARLQTLIFLRRAGLLTSESWSLTDILRPASPIQETSE